MVRRCHLIYDKQKNTYIVLFKGDDTDFAWNQEIALEIETDLDLTGFTAKFSVLGFVQDFDDITSKKLNLVFPAEETSKFPLGMTDAVFEVFDTDGKKRTIINTLKVLVTKSVYEAYSNEDPQAITVSISGTIEREQSDWTETDTSSPSFIKHKPDLGEKLDGDAVYEKWYDSDYYEPDTIVSHNGYLWKCIRFTPEEPSDSAEDWEMIRAEYVFAPKDSPNLIGTPTAPTAPAGTNTEQIATTAFVASSLQGHIPEPSSQTPLEDGIGSPGTGNKFSRNDHVHPHDSSKQDKLSQEQLNNINAVPSKAPLASPALTGTPTAPTAASGTNTTQIANTAFVHGAVSGKANASDVADALAQKLDGAAEYPAWVDGDAYTADEIVSHNGRIWKSLVTNFDKPGTDPTKWVEVFVGDLLEGKQDALTTPQLDAVNSGVTAEKVTTWDALPAQVAAKQDALTSAQLANIAAVPGKMPMYPMVAMTPSNGTITIAPYSVATYTAGTSAASFTVAVGAGTAGMARDCELVIDCTATGAVAPTVTWPATFHPRTDAATDFACEAGTRNVYFISEYAAGEFAVGGWQETTGGNA